MLPRFLELCALFVLFAGCTHTYEVSHPTIAATSVKLDRRASAYLALPEDGSLNASTSYPGSGRFTAEVVRKEFGQHLSSIHVASSVEAYNVALASAHSRGDTYLIYPEILHWEDRQTAWSGLPDRILLRISVIDVQSGKPIDSAEIAGKSKWATFGGDDPKDLVEPAVRQYVASVF